MATSTDICNIALARLNIGPIQSLDEVSDVAKTCKRIYDHIREAILRERQWSFAIKTEYLALSTDDSTRYAYVYTYPTDCLRAIRIVVPTQGVVQGFPPAAPIYSPEPISNKTINFEIMSNSTLNGRLIMTDQVDAELLYLGDVENVNAFDPMFREALAWRMAADLAIPLLGKPEVQQAYMQSYIATMSAASTVDANESSLPTHQSNAFLDARD
jgi:hypothetical protein